MDTITLRNGTVVLAKKDKKHGLCAVQFVNNTQAEIKQIILLAMGIESVIYSAPMNLRVKYLKIINNQ